MGRQDSEASMQRLDRAVQGGGGRLTDELLLLLRKHLAQEQVGVADENVLVQILCV